MQIKYIIDSPYEGKFTLTDTRDGDHNDLTEEVARDLFDNHADECFFSARADVSLRSVSCEEVKVANGAQMAEIMGWETPPSQRHDW